MTTDTPAIDLRVAQVVPDGPHFTPWFDVMHESATHERPDALVWEHDDLREHLLSDNPGERSILLGAWEGENLVGTGMIELPQQDNLTRAHVDVNVRPSQRRRGIGTALFQQLLSRGESHDRSVYEAEISLPGTAQPGSWPGVAFAEHHGFKVANTEDHLALALPAHPQQPSMDDEYQVVTWENAAPDVHAEAYASMLSALSADIPSGELTREPEHWDVERLRASEATGLAQGRTLLVAGAVDSCGNIVGHTSLTITAGDDASIFQGDTYVMTAHRRRGLGRALKVANLHRLNELSTAAGSAIHTWTSPENTGMTALNKELGFSVVETTCELERTVENNSK